ncbi:MAG: 2-amino-4-hydroxy-6-hydroxymethyldihydropteridine diphosphokinase [Bryobacteraceae bacterium]
MKKIYLSLGSNLGDRSANISAALAMLADARLRILRQSSLYETEPRDLPHQPWFLNLVAEAETSLFPMMLLHRIVQIERTLGRRRRTAAKGPRLIDVDIVFYGQSVMNGPKLTVPHARMHERRFVLEPLAELAPEMRHPATRRTVREMLAAVKDQNVKKVSS